MVLPSKSDILFYILMGQGRESVSRMQCRTFCCKAALWVFMHLETGPSAKPGPLGLDVAFLWDWKTFLSTQT